MTAWLLAERWAQRSHNEEEIMMKRILNKLIPLAIALAMLFTAAALADQTLEGDANVDQRFYPSTSPFIHPPFFTMCG